MLLLAARRLGRTWGAFSRAAKFFVFHLRAGGIMHHKEESPFPLRDGFSGEVQGTAAASAAKSVAHDVPLRTSDLKLTREPDLRTDKYEYETLYRPIMFAVYTARHKKNPTSDDALYEHIFSSNPTICCDVCKEEVELLVSHQREFF